MNTPASAVVPSREAVEGAIQYFHLGSIDHTLKGKTVADMLRTLLAEVERLTKEYAAVNNERGSQTAAWPDAWKYVAELKASSNSLWQETEQLRTTVADQAAALAERDKDNATQSADVRTGDTLITAEHMTLTECQIALWIVLRKHRNKGKVYISRDEWDQAIGQRLEIGEYASGNVFIAALAASVSTQEEK